MPKGGAIRFILAKPSFCLLSPTLPAFGFCTTFRSPSTDWLAMVCWTFPACPLETRISIVYNSTFSVSSSRMLATYCLSFSD